MRKISRAGLIIVFLFLVGVITMVTKSTLLAVPSNLSNVSTIDDIVRIFPQSADEVNARTKQYLAQAHKAVDELCVLKPEERTFANTAQELDAITSLSDLSVHSHVVSALEITSADEKIREAAHDAVVLCDEFWVERVSNNVDLYNAIKAYAQGNGSQESLTDEQRYFLTKTIEDFEREGLNLPADKRQRVLELNKELAKLSQDFEANIAADDSKITVAKEGLAGLDEEFISNLKRSDEGQYILGVDYPTYNNVRENCAVEDTRKKLYLAFVNRAYPKNDELLKEIIAKRDELAKLLGFENYAQLDIDDEMVKKPERADSFLRELLAKSKKKFKQEVDLLVHNLPDKVQLVDKKLKPWDIEFIRNTYKKQHLALDEREIAEYFPLQSTIDGLLDIYQQFLNIRFKEIKLPSKTWHEDVHCIQVSNADNTLLGYLLLDLHPRPFKFSHACELTLVGGSRNEDGSVNPTISGVLANFPKPTDSKPALLKRDDAGTFFHEFGHALHDILGPTRMASFSGTNVKRDFVEVPSQMFEEWLWDKEMLKKVSRHYETGQPLPDELIDKILKLKRFETGFFVTYQTYNSLLSLAYYLNGAQKDPYAIMKDLYTTILSHSVFEPENRMYASFGHLMDYGAKYYSYLWSKVFSLDLFYEIKKHGLLNSEIGKKYVDTILAKGGSKDPEELLKDFLGREPNMNAFIDDLGLS